VKPSRLRKLALAASLVLAGLAAAVGAQAEARGQGYSRDAQRVLSQARTASGGAGWNFLRGWHETGRDGAAAYEAWLDPLRYGLRVESHEPDGLHTHGFNGQGAWHILPNGATSGGGEGPLVAEARTEAFFAVYGFLFPGRFDASGRYIGQRRLRNRSFDVVEVKPWGGRARNLWFDRRTHLLSRMVEGDGPHPLTFELSDYRRVGPVLVAFRQTRDDGDPGGPRQRQLDSLTFVPADRGVFSLPRPVAEAPAP